MYYVYILLLKNNDLYKGFTTNISQRLKEHNAGKVKSTKNYLSVTLIHYECYLEKSDAMRREKFLKRNEGRILLKKQIRDALTKLL